LDKVVDLRVRGDSQNENIWFEENVVLYPPFKRHDSVLARNNVCLSVLGAWPVDNLEIVVYAEI
jgi:hypothetical protein